MNKLDIFFKENEDNSVSKQLLENMLTYTKNNLINETTTIEDLYINGQDYATNGNLDKLSMQLSKRAFERIKAKHLVGVQPMNGPIGVYYALRFIADQTYTGDGLYDTSATELGYNKLDNTYSGSYSTSAGELLGSNATGDIGLGIGDGTVIKEISMTIEKDRVESQTRKLRTRWSLEVAQDIFSMHNIVLRDMLIDGMAKEIATEIDSEIIAKMESVATTTSLDFTSVIGAMGVNKSDIYNSFISYVIAKCNDIGSNTNHGVGNFIIASKNISTALESTAAFSYGTAEDKNDEGDISFAGRLCGKKLYRNIFWEDDKFLVGYKGPTELDAGIFYLPYLQVFLSGILQDSMNPTIGAMSRYGIGENIFGASNYYQKVNITNFA